MIKEQILFWCAKKKDKDAFAQAYDLYADKIFRFIFLKISNKIEAQDLTSRVFLKAWEYILKKEIKEIKTLGALFYQIARNLIIDYYRSNANKNDIFLSEAEELEKTMKDEKVDLLRDQLIKADLEQIKKALAELREEYREVIVFHYIEELSIGEIAGIIGKSKGAVKVLLHRAIKNIKRILIN